ncbi:MAG: AAA family ATPase, partial [Deltaproteobacteria bacterium]|nr:AAA family ATPase [Deltaproteobacteria bacterium]
MKENQGNLAKVGLPQLLHLIYMKGDRAAALDIVREPVKKRFFFKDGVPAGASSNILNEVLGRLLMQEGIISQKDYETSLEAVLKEKKKHGEVLISMGLLTAEQLDSFLVLQLKRRLWRIFGWNEGTYRYTKIESVPQAISHPSLHPASLILEGVSLGFYPAPRLKADIKDLIDKPFSAAADPGKYSLDSFNLNLQEKRFLSSFDGARNLKEVVESSDLLRHRALSLALSFIITGLIKGPRALPEPEFFEEEAKERPLVTPGAAGDTRLNAELLFMRAKSALAAGDYTSAVTMFREITDLNPVEGEYWAYLGWALYNENPEAPKEAEKVIKDSIDLNNDLDSAWYFLGEVLLASRERGQAASAFKTARQKNPWLSSAGAELKRLELAATEPAYADSDGRGRYTAYYGLKDDPFRDIPQKPSFSPASRGEVLDAIKRSVMRRSGPIFVGGAKGAGKTTFIIDLLHKLSDEKVLTAAVLKPPSRELDLIKAINAEVGGTSEANSVKEQLLSFGMRVSQNKIQGGHTLIIIDDSDRLSAGCLKLIQYLSRLKTLQMVLVGEPSFLERLSSPEFAELKERVKTVHELKPFTEEETGEYIKSRLDALKTTAGSYVFTPDEVREIHSSSGGSPSLINRKAAERLFASLEAGLEKGAGREGAVEGAGALAGSETEEAAHVDTRTFAFEPPFSFDEAEKAPQEKEGGLPPDAGLEVAEAYSIEGDAKKTEPVAESHETTAGLTGNEIEEPSAAIKGETPIPEPPLPAPPVHARPSPPAEGLHKKEVVHFEKAGKSAGRRLTLWIILMIIAGLAIGSAIGIVWFRKDKA